METAGKDPARRERAREGNTGHPTDDGDRRFVGAPVGGQCHLACFHSNPSVPPDISIFAKHYMEIGC